MNTNRFIGEEAEEFQGFVQQLINEGKFDSPAKGIAMQVVDKGYSSLSSKQKYVFDQAFEPYYFETCSRDGTPIPWSEMDLASDNGGLCGYCQHQEEKMMKE